MPFLKPIVLALAYVTMLAQGVACRDASQDQSDPALNGPTASAQTPAQIKGAIQEAFGELFLPFEQQEIDRLPTRLREARRTHNISGKSLAEFLTASHSPDVLAAGAMACFSEDFDRNDFVERIKKQKKGDAAVLGGVLFHTASSLTAACQLGIDLLDEGAFPSMVGHTLLSRATLAPVEPETGSWKPGVTVAVDEERWAFLRDIKELSYRTVFLDALKKVKSRFSSSDAPENTHRMLRVIAEVGQHPKPSVFWTLEQNEVEGWFNQVSTEIEFEAVKAHVNAPRRMAEAYLLSQGRGPAPR